MNQPQNEILKFFFHFEEDEKKSLKWKRKEKASLNEKSFLV